MMPAASNKTENKSSSEALEPAKAILLSLEKKLRNVEKRKSKLDVIRDKKAAGDTLEKEQQETLKHYNDVVANLEFARDLQKTFNATLQDMEKQQKKQQKREKQERAASDLKRTADILQIQTTLDALGNDGVREHFKSGKHGAVVLTEDNLDSLDELYKLIMAPAAGEENFSESLNTAAEHVNSLLELKEKPVAGSTYKELMDLLQLIIGCGYFERAREAEEEKNKASEAAEEVEEAPEEAEEASSPVEETSPSTEAFSEPPQPEVQTPSAPVHPPAPEIEEPSLPSHTQQVLQSSGVPQHEGPPSNTFVGQMPMSASPTLFQPPPPQPQPPVPQPPKSRPLEEIVSQVEGTFSFLQESELDMDSPHMDPAVVAAQPMMRPPPPQSSAPSQPPPQQTAPILPPQGPPAPFPPHAESEEVDPLSLSQQSLGQTSLDYSGASQSFGQAGLSHSQSLSSGVVADAMFQPPVEDAAPAPPPAQQPHPPVPAHGMMGQAMGSSGENQYDLPPSIPLPPSQQAQQDASQLSGQEKKFQLNASATEFQSRSMYSQMPMGLQSLPSQPPPQPQGLNPQPPAQPPHPAATHPEARGPMPPPNAVNTDFPSGPNFAQAAGDFTQQGGNFQGGNFQRGGRGGGGNPGYRGGPRGGRGGNNNSNAMQNGFNQRPQNGNPRPSNRGAQGGNSYQGFPPRNDYRPDGFQGYNTNGFGGGAPYPKRGGAGGPGGFPRGGGNNRGAGGMRGGVPRGGPPRGAGGNRGGLNRPVNQ